MGAIGLLGISVWNRTEFSIPETAVMLGMHRSSVYWRVRMGYIPSHVVSPPNARIVRRKVPAVWSRKELVDTYDDALVRLSLHFEELVRRDD